MDDYLCLIGRGINLGNALEGPTEGEWGVMVHDHYFERIRDAGFNSVRLPVRWSAHAAKQPPYTIEPTFFERIDWILGQALGQELVVILNVQHYDELMQHPGKHRARFLAIWRQIAQRYRDYPRMLYFELLNEPHGVFTAQAWNALAAAALACVRESNPERVVVIGPVNYNSVDQLAFLDLPAQDQRVMATFHFYEPFHFTHQGAAWVDHLGSDSWLGTTWDGTDAQKSDIAAMFAKAQTWAHESGRPLFMGEFGSFGKADMTSRARWTRFVRDTAEQHDLPWLYWEFCSGFGAYDPETNQWRQPLLQALTWD